MQTKIFATFETWDAVLAAARECTPLYYHAPMDLRPTRVLVVAAFKNGKIRIAGGSLTFTVDAGHLSRFRYLAPQSANVTDAYDYLRVHGFMVGGAK